MPPRNQLPQGRLLCQIPNQLATLRRRQNQVHSPHLYESSDCIGVFKKLSGHCNKAGNIYAGGEGGGAVLQSPHKVAPRGQEEGVTAAVSMKWFSRDWEGSNAGAKYQTGLKARAFIIVLPCLGNLSGKQHRKQKKLKGTINKLRNSMCSKKGSK